MNFLTLMAAGAFIFFVMPFIIVAAPAFFSAIFGQAGVLIGIVVGFALIMKIGGMI